MPARRPAADHAALLASDAEAVAHAAIRLCALLERLNDDPSTPPWFTPAAEAHLKATTTAASDLSEAATALQSLSQATTPTPLPPAPRNGRADPTASSNTDTSET